MKLYETERRRYRRYIKNVQSLGFMKDINDTFKPYKSIDQLVRDLLLQPYYGLVNTVKGVWFFIYGVFDFLYCFLIKFPANLFSRARRYNGESVIKSTFKLPVLRLGAGVLFFIRGVTQIASWPLTILRAPLRGIITAFKGVPKIEDNPGIRRLVAKYDTLVSPDEKILLAHVLIMKFLIASKKGQKARKNSPLLATGSSVRKIIDVCPVGSALDYGAVYAAKLSGALFDGVWNTKENTETADAVVDTFKKAIATGASPA